MKFKMQFKMKFKKTKNEDNRASVREKNRILSNNSHFSFRESYNTIRANLLVSLPSEGCKVIGVTSALPSEGKSINCLNLAIAFGESGARVLLVDGNFRSPMVARLFRQKMIPGLADLLIDNKEAEALTETEASLINIKNIINPCHPYLSIIPAGVTKLNPSSFLASEKLHMIFSALKEHYDYIFIDTPAVLAVSDAILLSKYMDGIVVVAREGETGKKSLIKVINQFEFAGTNILGVILNGVPQRKLL